MYGRPGVRSRAVHSIMPLRAAIGEISAAARRAAAALARSVGGRWYTCWVLHELRVENLLLIERAELRLAPGLNVLTGETGAGKTVLAQALDLLLGGRARAGIVRPGAGEAYVEGVFDLPPGLREQLGDSVGEDAEEIVLARRVGSDGRTRAYLNGRSAAVGDLRDLGGALLAFYGQHEHRKLTLAGAQMEILDGLGGEQQRECLDACAATFALRRELEVELSALQELASQRDRELDLLEFELGEIETLAPDELEHTQLLAARERLRRADALRAGAGAAGEALAPDDGDGVGAAQLLAAAVVSLDALAGADAQIDALAERARALAIESQDLAAELRAYCETESLPRIDGAVGLLAGEDVSLEAIEERLSGLERLMRKHGGSIAGVLAHAEQARARREELNGAHVAVAGPGRASARSRPICSSACSRCATRARASRPSSPRRCASSSRRSRWATRASRSRCPSASPGPAAATRSSS